MNALITLAQVGMPKVLILVIILASSLIVMLITLASRYKRCPSNKILVVYGKTGGGAAKCIHGGASFIWPLIQERPRRLSSWIKCNGNLRTIQIPAYAVNRAAQINVVLREENYMAVD